MARKFKLLILLAAVWAALYFILTAGESASLFFASAHPSGRPMPVAWSDRSRPVVVLKAPGVAEPAQSSDPQPLTKSSTCPATYTVQKGDTLGSIAGHCGVTIEHLKVSNPTLLNPNRIYPGQQLTIDPSQSPTTAPLLVQPTARFAPGSTIQVESAGFPPNAQVRIGIGLSATGYRLLTTASTDAQGNLSAIITIPANARSGDTAFILLATQSVPTVQAISGSFQLTP